VTTIQFTVPGEPASKARARFTGRGSKTRAFTPEKTRQAEAQVAAAYLSVANRSNKADVATAFRVVADFHLARNQRRDVDNMLKLILDGLNDVAWGDDSQVIEVVARKFYHVEDARTDVTVEPIGLVPRSEGQCEHCGSMFPRPPSHAAKKYCNAECRRAGVAAKRTRSCKHCGSRFTRHGDASSQEFCSADCRYKSTHVDAICVRCETPFTKPRSLNRSGNSYCSPACKATYWRDRNKSAAKGTCSDCGGPTTKKTYIRCRDCQYAAGGRHAYKEMPA